jgi:hypothetical protein
MTPSRAVIATKSPEGKVSVREYNLRSKTPSGVTVASSPVIRDAEADYKEDGTVTMTFSIPLSKESSLSYGSMKPSGFIFAAGNQIDSDGTLSQHEYTGTASVVLDSNGSAVQSNSNRSAQVITHAVFMAVID